MRAKHSAVVPAQAGTHNHGKEFGEDSSSGTAINLQSNHHAVWVPAYAGTTPRVQPIARRTTWGQVESYSAPFASRFITSSS